MLENLWARKRRGQEEGFTLIELLIVIVILGILAAIVVFAVGGITDKGNKSACKSDQKTLEVASEAYYAQNNVYATSAQALKDAKLVRALHPNGENGYTITYTPGTGEVTASGACTV